VREVEAALDRRLFVGLRETAEYVLGKKSNVAGAGPNPVPGRRTAAGAGFGEGGRRNQRGKCQRGQR
jgi:hypothetical protein